MPDFLMFMHADTLTTESDAAWEAYLASLKASGNFLGGSDVGTGEAFRQSGIPQPVTAHINGFIRITARDLTDARRFLAGNPTYEAGGTIEIRELPVS